jgi:hypothetical protein
LPGRRTLASAHLVLRTHRTTGGNGMANKIEIRPLDKKETTGDSGGNGGA